MSNMKWVCVHYTMFNVYWTSQNWDLIKTIVVFLCHFYGFHCNIKYIWLLYSWVNWRTKFVIRSDCLVCLQAII